MALSEQKLEEMAALSDLIARVGTKSDSLPHLKKMDVLLHQMSAIKYDIELHDRFQRVAFDNDLLPFHTVEDYYTGPALTVVETTASRSYYGTRLTDTIREQMLAAGVAVDLRDMEYRTYRVFPVRLVEPVVQMPLPPVQPVEATTRLRGDSFLGRFFTGSVSMDPVPMVTTAATWEIDDAGEDDEITVNLTSEFSLNVVDIPRVRSARLPLTETCGSPTCPICSSPPEPF